MNVDFLKYQIVPKVWGYEKIIVNNNLYCGKILTTLPNGNASSVHYHCHKVETFFIIRGELCVQLFDMEQNLKKSMMLKPGEIMTIHPMSPHRFWSDNELCEFMEVSTFFEDEDSHRMVPAGPKPVEHNIDV